MRILFYHISGYQVSAFGSSLLSTFLLVNDICEMWGEGKGRS